MISSQRFVISDISVGLGGIATIGVMAGGVTKFSVNSFRICDIRACSVRKSDRILFIIATCSDSIVAIEGAGAVVVSMVDGPCCS